MPSRTASTVEFVESRQVHTQQTLETRELFRPGRRKGSCTAGIPAHRVLQGDRSPLCNIFALMYATYIAYTCMYAMYKTATACGTQRGFVFFPFNLHEVRLMLTLLGHSAFPINTFLQQVPSTLRGCRLRGASGHLCHFE